MIKILVFKPGLPPEVVETDDSLDSIMEIVGGRVETAPISDTDPIMSELDLVVNEEGVLLDLEPNRFVSIEYNHGIIRGTFFVTKFDGDGDFVSLSDREIEHAKEYIESINRIIKASVQKD